MKVLEVTTDLFQELTNNQIVVCLYTSELGEPIFGIDLSYKTQYPLLNEVDVIDENNGLWHEPDKNIKIIQNKSGVVWGIMNQKDIAYALVSYRETNNITTYDEGDKLYFYANSILPQHQAIFDAYPGLEITVNEK